VFRLRRKKEKEIYFKNLKKKKRKHLFGALQITSTHTHALSFSLFLARQIHAPRTRILRYARYSVLFLKTTYLSLSTRYNIPLFLYARSIILSCTLSIPVSLILAPLRLSTRSIYLFYFSVVHSFASTLTLLRYVHVSWRARGERERDAGPIKKIITRFRGTSSSPNFDAPRSRKQTGDVG